MVYVHSAKFLIFFSFCLIMEVDQQPAGNLQTPPTDVPLSIEEQFEDNTLLLIFRILLYILFMVKLLEICFVRRRKLRINERIQRKFIFAHGPEMIRGFSQEETHLMNLTLKNTLKNATELLPSQKKPRTDLNERKVRFTQEANIYYDPPSFSSKIQVDNHLEKGSTHSEQQQINSFIEKVPIPDEVKAQTLVEDDEPEEAPLLGEAFTDEERGDLNDS